MNGRTLNNAAADFSIFNGNPNFPWHYGYFNSLPSGIIGFNSAATTGDGLALTDTAGQVRPLEEIEAEVIRFAIAHYRGQMSEVARRLRIGRSTLYRKLDEIGLSERTESDERHEDAKETGENVAGG